jgi:hypothetical protein
LSLYRHIEGQLSEEEYGLLLKAAQGVQSVLEFGPGSSTWAFIEAGVPEVVSCESDPAWIESAQAQFGERVEIVWFDRKMMPLDIPALNNRQFDLAFVDAPVGAQSGKSAKIPGHETRSRINSVVFALEHARRVFLHDAKRKGEQRTLQFVQRMGYRVKTHDTLRGMAEIWR